MTNDKPSAILFQEVLTCDSFYVHANYQYRVVRFVKFSFFFLGFITAYLFDVFGTQYTLFH